MRPIPYVDLAAQYAEERADLEPRIMRCLATGRWVGSEHVEGLERELSAYCHANHAVALASGTDALILALRGLGVGRGDEVITPPNSFVSSTAAIVAVGATPVFADVLACQGLDPAAVEAALTPRTRALMPVHLTGRIAEMPTLLAIARAHDLFVVEDAAQAFGARLGQGYAGTLGSVGCFSAHPLKNLNACGDAGFVLTDDTALAQRVARLRNNGLADRNTVLEWGTVSRLDAVQATILRFRLERLDSNVAARRRNASYYIRRFAPDVVQCPPWSTEQGRLDVFHTFVVQVDKRDELQRYLAERGISTGIHYPIPLHLQPAARSLGYKAGDFPMAERQAARMLSLPIHPHLCDADLERVVRTIHEFYGHA